MLHHLQNLDSDEIKISKPDDAAVDCNQGLIQSRDSLMHEPGWINLRCHCAIAVVYPLYQWSGQLIRAEAYQLLPPHTVFWCFLVGLRSRFTVELRRLNFTPQRSQVNNFNPRIPEWHGQGTRKPGKISSNFLRQALRWAFRLGAGSYHWNMSC
jgi:hypothetical protein